MVKNDCMKKNYETSERKAIRVLILTNNLRNTRSLERHLSNFSEYTVEIGYVLNSAQALYKLRNERFDLILLDSRFGPDTTAKDVVEIFGEREVQLPVIIVASKPDEQSAVELVKIGAYDYITEDNLDTELFEKTILTSLERYARLAEEKRLE